LTDQNAPIGELIDGKYRIDRRLGYGGMGAVYRATHLGTKRTVAVKVIHPQYSNQEEFVERFRREAEAAGRLRHPNVVDVTDFGFAHTSSGRVAYLVMEYLDGCTLAEVLAEEKQLPASWVVDILEQVCSAVDEAHRLGLIHRDLKPDNIWLEPNRRGGYTIKVLDFGLVKFEAAKFLPSEAPGITRGAAKELSPTNVSVATESQTLIKPASAEEAGTLMQNTLDQPPARATDASVARETAGITELTRFGSVMGTPLYMSPEQWRGEHLDVRSDIYSLGVIAYRMLTGETPFTGNFADLGEMHNKIEPPPIREKNPKVPKKMARQVMSALAKNPAHRPESAAGFASALRASVEGSGTILRHAISLYSEQFPVFLKTSLIAYAPLIIILAFLNLNDSTLPWVKFPPQYLMMIGLLLFIFMIVANLLAYFTVSAATASIVIQLIIAPLRPLRVGAAFAALRRRWLTFSVASILVLLMILLGAALFVIPGMIIAIFFALYAPVAVMENIGVFAVLKRALKLMKRSWVTVFVITLLQFALPVLVWKASIDSTIVLKLAEDYSPKEFSFGFSISGLSSLYQLLNIFVTPLTAIMTSLLYLKTRQAGGESLRDAAEQVEALDIPKSNWQARMRSRHSSPSSTIKDQETENLASDLS
jgi:serine/threonine protein kinase